ncbi:DUF1236 domain-containing protein [Devosia rhodophyticola]|uniref:DUF1236 domain-containing protein n=1 Tax=Devosia rhodophyticola TaxID=3026423 RepID=A0ABY7Z288_9HYPH|nr:DUF1236 domain-containing protein [Devosia rhodophyticola]WDR07110.1 DUF1236 domain-containing protein [Devosia rhodophyticola]
MKNILLATVAVLSLGAMTPAFAQTTTDANAAVGATAGGTGGAALGFVLGGPIGAVVGGFAGATLGAEAGVAATTVEYAGTHPVEPIYIDGSVDIGATLPADVTIHPVEGDAQYGYVYANDRVWIVDMQSRALVQSPGYLVPQATADFVVNNPVGTVNVNGDIVVGYQVPADVQLTAVPDDRTYSYAYINDRPVLVENSSRAVVWIK